MSKIKKFLKDKKEYFIGSGIITAVFMIYLIISGIWPFGTNTLAKYDGYFQVTQLFGYMFDVIDGNATIAFSNLLGGGANTVAVWSYFLLNPFAFIALIFGRNNIYFAINVMYLLYFILIYNVFLYFLRKKFVNLSKIHTIIISCLYTFCAYTLCNYTIIVWLNFLIILPLLVLEFEKLITQGKIWGFSILTALCMYTSYSVGASLQIILVLLYFLYVFVVLPKENRGKACLNLIVGLLSGLLLSVLILLPSMLQLGSSCRISADVGSIFNYKQITRVNEYAMSTYILFNIMNVSLLIIAIWSLIKSFKQDKFSKFLLFSLIICNLPILFDDITHFLSGGAYIHFSTRFFSINSVLLFISVAKAFSKPEGTKELINITDNKKTNWFAYVVLGLLTIILIIATTANYIALGAKLSIGELLPKELLGYIGVPITIVAIIVISYIFTRTKSMSKKFFSTLMLVVICVESFIGGLCSISAHPYSTENATAYYNLTHNLSPNSRVKEGVDFIGANGALISGVSSYSIFSSVAENNTYLLSKYLGYAPGVPCVSNDYGTLFADIMLGYEYVVTARNLDDRSYLSLVDTYNDFRLYKYNFSMPRAFVLDSVVTPETHNSLATNYKELAQMFGETQVILSSVDSSEFKTSNELDLVVDDWNQYKISFVAPSSGIAYITNVTKNLTFNVYNQEKQYCGQITYNKYLDIAELQAGETYSFYLVSEDEINNEDYTMSTLSVDAVKSIAERAQQNKVDISYSASGYEIDATNLNNKNILVLQANPKGMVYSSNNNESSFTASSAIYDFTYIQNVNNEKITAEFVYPYTNITLIVGLGSILAAIIIIFVFTKFRQKFKFLEKIAYIGYMVVTCAIVLVFYIWPSFIAFFKILSIL